MLGLQSWPWGWQLSSQGANVPWCCCAAPAWEPRSPAPLGQGTPRQTCSSPCSLRSGPAPYSSTYSLVLTLLQLTLHAKALPDPASSKGPPGLWADEIQHMLGAEALGQRCRLNPAGHTLKLMCTGLSRDQAVGAPQQSRDTPFSVLLLHSRNPELPLQPLQPQDGTPTEP